LALSRLRVAKHSFDQRWRKKAREMLLVDDWARNVLRVLIREMREPCMIWGGNEAASMLCLRAAHLAGELGGTVERMRRNPLMNV